MEVNKVYNEDCLTGLKKLPDNCIDCCVTSPPYYGLRDYGCDGQIGLEQSPTDYIDRLTEVFADVFRVLKPEGTLWLNLGDSYAGSGKGAANYPDNAKKYKQGSNRGTVGNNTGYKYVTACKDKDLMLIPFEVAKALRGPFYMGKIRDEKDRVWLAAMIDGEGSIVGTHHIRKDDNSERTNVYVCVTNTNDDILQKCMEIFPDGTKLMHQKNGTGHLGKRDVYRWHTFDMECKKQLVCELYPYLVAKKKQALLAYNFFLFQENAKHYGHSERKDEVREKRNILIQLISSLNKGENIDIPSWCIEPPSLYSKGFYLRNDIIWAKPNAMPESVTDRLTKSHEYIFLMSKSSRYYFDHEAIQEIATGYDGRKDTVFKGSQKYIIPVMPHGNRQTMAAGGHQRWRFKNLQEDGQTPNTMHLRLAEGLPDKQYPVRNKRDVWSVSTKPDSNAHFAVYPEELIRPCILAGCPKDGIVLDPFMGSGTTARVARKYGRNFIGYELNPEYIKIIEKKIIVEQDMFV